LDFLFSRWQRGLWWLVAGAGWLGFRFYSTHSCFGYRFRRGGWGEASAFIPP